MPECAYLKKCPFFAGRLPHMPAMAELYKKMYYKGDYKKCARFIVREETGPDSVPLNLFPCQKERLELLIRKVKSR